MSPVLIHGKEYISLKEASKLTKYTTDYVGQLARQEKVPSEKIGRARYVEKKPFLLYAYEQHKLRKGVLPPFEKKTVEVQKKKTSSPSKHPARHIVGVVYEEDDTPLMPELRKEVNNSSSPARPEVQDLQEKIQAYKRAHTDPDFQVDWRRVTKAALVPAIFLFTLWATLGFHSHLMQARNIAATFSHNVDEIISETRAKHQRDGLVLTIGDSLLYAVETGDRRFDALKDNTQEFVKETPRRIADALQEGETQVAVSAEASFIKTITRKVFDVISYFSGNQNSSSRALVFVESEQENNANLIKQIKNTFSDEVEVKVEDSTTGIVRPVFREGPGEEYLYVIVPAPDG